MKLTYLSVYKDGTGYANAAIRNMLALQAGGIDVVARSISLSNNKNYELAESVKHLENKKADSVDIIIQHILPHFFEYKSGVKNIGCFEWETTLFNRANWPRCCDLMDEIWVPCIQNAQAAIDSGVTVPIKIFPHSCETDRFRQKPIPVGMPDVRDKCVFYTIGETSRRKNIIATIRAFYSTFTSRDDVVLIIKTNIPWKTPDEGVGILRSTIEDIKKSIHIYARQQYYPQIVCITDFLSDSQIDQIHSIGNVFVMPSHGEAWCIPAHDALAFGNPVIASNWGAFPELMYEQAQSFWMPDSKIFKYPGEINCGWLVKGQLTPCFGQTDSFPDLYTGHEQWYDPDICHLCECMKQAYGEWKNGKLNIKGEAAKQRALNFSYDKVGIIARNLLGA